MSNKMELRPYQAEAVYRVEEQWRSGVQKTLLVLPTGTGKTICFAKIAENCVRQGMRVLILAHRGELLDQAADDMEALEKENAELRAKLKVLVDKVEEYRRVESGIRQALTTAQNVAEQTTKKAKEESEQTLSTARQQAEKMKADASAQCEALIRQYQIQASQEQARLRLAQHECAAFINKMTQMFREESERIAEIPQQVGLEFASISGQTVRSETLESHVEGLSEPEPVPEQHTSGTEIPDDILKIFADASHASRKNGMEQTKFTVEVSGSSDQSEE